MNPPLSAASSSVGVSWCSSCTETLAPAEGPSLLVRFTREAVPEVDLKGGKVVVELPPEAPDDDDDES